MQKPENEKSEEMKITQLVATIIMIRLTSNVSRLKMDAGKLFKESSLLRALNLVRAPAGWQTKGFHKQKSKRCSTNDYTRLSSPLLSFIEKFMFWCSDLNKNKKSQRSFVWLFIWPFRSLDFA